MEEVGGGGQGKFHALGFGQKLVAAARRKCRQLDGVSLSPAGSRIVSCRESGVTKIDHPCGVTTTLGISPVCQGEGYGATILEDKLLSGIYVTKFSSELYDRLSPQVRLLLWN